MDVPGFNRAGARYRRRPFPRPGVRTPQQWRQDLRPRRQPEPQRTRPALYDAIPVKGVGSLSKRFQETLPTLLLSPVPELAEFFGIIWWFGAKRQKRKRRLFTVDRLQRCFTMI